MKPGLEKLFREYSESHKHPTNRLTHKIAIPMIVFHILAMLDWVKLFQLPGLAHPISLAYVAYAIAMAWYLWQDVKLGTLVGLGFAACIPLGWYVPAYGVVAIAVVGWLVQLAGHVVWEKKQPSFFTNLVHALVGPVFFVAVLVGEWRLEEQPQVSTRPA
ncbi:MAG TPA: Mpo1-like protein [Myxococcaceae bacterium]|nr:Mpo1-like protein [Myxococcaceae bacterium]